jgi:hypothetical protein
VDSILPYIMYASNIIIYSLYLKSAVQINNRMDMLTENTKEKDGPGNNEKTKEDNLNER